MRISDFGLRSGEWRADHETRVTNHEKAQWPNEANSAQSQGGMEDTWGLAIRGVRTVAAECIARAKALGSLFDSSLKHQ